MPKNLLQDVVKVKNTKSDFIGQSGERPDIESRFSSYYNTVRKNRDIKKDEDKYTEEEDYGKPRSRYGLWVVALASIVILFFALSFLFSSATITVTPKVKSVTFNEKISASKDMASADSVPFDFIAISDEQTGTLPGGAEQNVAEKAKGTVVIYNTFGAASQNLDIDTRLEGSNGKIYKTVAKITVPGMKNGTPGSVEVGIYGAEAGEEYNSAPLDFKIFGFKGTPKYAKFYARSKSDITGGVKGMVKSVADADKTKAVADLKTALQAKLLQKATDQIPPGFVLFKDAVFLNIDNETVDVTSKESQIPVSVKGTLYGFLFDEKAITKKIAEATVSGYDGTAGVHIQNLKDLSFAITSKDAPSFKDVKNMTFNLSGSPQIVWDIDTAKLATDVLGKKKKDFNTILAQYPSIDLADLSLRPIWKMSFPEKLKDIKVVVQAPE